MQNNGKLIQYCWECKTGAITFKSCLAVFTKANMHTHDPEILPNPYLIEKCIFLDQNTGTRIFIAAFFFLSVT